MATFMNTVGIRGLDSRMDIGHALHRLECLSLMGFYGVIVRVSDDNVHIKLLEGNGFS